MLAYFNLQPDHILKCNGVTSTYILEEARDKYRTRVRKWFSSANLVMRRFWLRQALPSDLIDHILNQVHRRVQRRTQSLRWIGHFSQVRELAVFQRELHVAEGLHQWNHLQVEFTRSRVQLFHLSLGVRVICGQTFQIVLPRKHIFPLEQNAGCAEILDQRQYRLQIRHFRRRSLQVKMDDSVVGYIWCLKITLDN